MNAKWQALAREAGIAAEHMAIGVTALERANYAQHAYYGQAFFALTIGLERATKLALLVDYVLENGGIFPTNEDVRKYQHDLRKLLEQADNVADRRGLSEVDSRLPKSQIHNNIIAILSDFANNITRYYNLDFVTSSHHSIKQVEPIKEWHEKVTLPILDMHYTQDHRKRDEQKALLLDQVTAGQVLIRQHAETGDELDSVYKALMQTNITKFAKPYTRLYVMQILRFIARLLSELGYAAYKLPTNDIPHLSEFFVIFTMSDSYIKKHKTWSIYS